MDYSASQTNHQQPPQPQPQYPEYHHYQYQSAYDPSQQVQPYDPSSYYAYNHQSAYDPSYYPPNYSNSYAQHTHHQFQQEPTSIHPPGVPIAQEPAPVAVSNQTHLPRNLYYSGNDSAAAVVAGGLSQDTDVRQLYRSAGNNAPLKIGQSLQKSWIRGVRPSRGGARGHFGQRGRRPGSSGTPSHARGRGQGGRHLPSGGAGSATGQALISSQAQVPAASRPPSRVGWCELCKVDCVTPEILEQHKNGKKHKKNLQVQGEQQGLEPITGQQNVQASGSEQNSRVLQPMITEGQNKSQPEFESIPSENVGKDDKNETKQPKEIVENSEVPAVKSGERKKILKEHFSEARGRFLKRKMMGGGRGGKYMRSFDGTRRPVESPKPKQVIPLVCELCNVKCDTQTVFQSHLAGKKHLSKLKRFHAGEVGLQSLYPANLNVPSTSLQPQVQQEGINDPQVLLAQLLTYVLSQAQAPGTVPAAGQVAGSVSVPLQGSGLETHYQQASGMDGPQANVEVGNQAAGTAEAVSGAPMILGSNMKPLTVSASENPDKDTEPALPAAASSDKPDPASEIRSVSSDQVVKPSSENCPEEPDLEDEDPEEEPDSEDEEDPEEQEPEDGGEQNE